MKLKDKVEETLEFYSKNTKLNAMFEFVTVKGKTSNIADERGNFLETSRSTLYFPPSMQLDIDGVYTNLAYLDGEDVFKVAEKYSDKITGIFERPINMKPIIVKNGIKVIKADSIQNKMLIRYLLYISLCTKGIIRYIDFNEVSNNKTSTDKFNLAKLYESLFDTKEGYDLIIKKLEDRTINADADRIGALNEKGEKDIIKNILTNIILTAKDSIVSKLSFDRDILQLIEKAIVKDIVGYNKDTKSFQMKDGGKFLKDEILYTVLDGNELVRKVLFSSFLQENKDKIVKLQSILSELK